MATTLGPLKIFAQTTVSNSSTVKLSLSSGNILSGGDNTSFGTTLSTPYQFPAGKIIKSPMVIYTSIDIPTNIEISALELKAVATNDSGANIALIGPGGSLGSSPGISVQKGLYYPILKTGSLPSIGIATCNHHTVSVRSQFPGAFPVFSDVDVNPTTGIYNKKMYISVIYLPVSLPHDPVVTYAPFNVAISLYGKEIIQVVPPPPPPVKTVSPTPTVEAPKPVVPPVQQTVPPIQTVQPLPKPTIPPVTNTIPKVEQTPIPQIRVPSTPVSSIYTPPEESQLAVQCVDRTSISLYGILTGPEFESEYIETIRQAVRVCEQIIWQANQTIIFSFATPFNPLLKRGQTIRIISNIYETEDFVVDFLALIKSISHVFDVTTGQVTTQILARGTEYVFSSSLASSDPTEIVDERQLLSL